MKIWSCLKYRWSVYLDFWRNKALYVKVYFGLREPKLALWTGGGGRRQGGGIFRKGLHEWIYCSLMNSLRVEEQIGFHEKKKTDNFQKQIAACELLPLSRNVSQMRFQGDFNRGYYMPARGYEFYLRVFNSISHEWAQRTSEYRVEHEKIKFVSTSGHVIVCLLYKHPNDEFFYDFPKISEHFQKISEDSPKVVRTPDKRFRTFSEGYRR